MPDAPASLAAALAALQADLPRIGKDKTARVTSQKTGRTHTYDYANLATVSAAIMPKLAALGLSFSTRPTMHPEHGFVLLYTLHFGSDPEESLAGFYPLARSDSPQAMGSSITYARRYCLCAVTGVAPDEDDDDVQAAEHEARQLQRGPVETRADGSATEAEQYRMSHGPVPGTERSAGTPPDDSYYDSGAEPAVIKTARMKAMFAAYAQLGIKDDDAMRADLSAILGRPVTSRKDLNLSELTTVGAILRRRIEQGATP